LLEVREMSPDVARPSSADESHRRPRILVCLDRSSLSEMCVPYAVSLARSLGASITLGYIMPCDGDEPGPPIRDVLDWAIASQEVHLALERVRNEMSATLGEPVDVRVEQGRPAVRIVDLARELHADVTVIAGRGEGAGAPSNLGTTVSQVISLARSSLFIVHPLARRPDRFTPERILVPLDGSVRAESVLPDVARVARMYSAEVLLLHVVREPLSTALLCDAGDVTMAQMLALRLEAAAHRYLDPLRERLSREVSSVRTLVVRHANERRCILEAIESTRSDLVILSAHGSACDSGQSFGGVTLHLLTHATVPLLALQDIREQEADDVVHIDARKSQLLTNPAYALGRP